MNTTVSPVCQSMLHIVLYISLVFKVVKICLKFTFYQIFVWLLKLLHRPVKTYWFRLNKGKSLRHFAFSKTILDIKYFHLGRKTYINYIFHILVCAYFIFNYLLFHQFWINVLFNFSHENWVFSFCATCFP